MKKQGKKRKKMLHDIMQERFLMYIQPMEQMDGMPCVEVQVRFRKFAKEHAAEEILKDREEDMSIVIYDLYIFETLCQKIQTWHVSEYKMIRYHIYFSSMTICQHDIDKQLEVLCMRYGVVPQEIGLILNSPKEYVNYDIYKHHMEILSNLGYTLILNSNSRDYEQLLNLPYSMVRFDMIEWEKEMTMKRSQSFFQSFLEGCHREHVQVIMGGIESEEQRIKSNAMECTYMLGDYIHKPMPLCEFAWIFERQQLIRCYE